MQYRRRRDDYVDFRPIRERMEKRVRSLLALIDNWTAKGSIPTRVRKAWEVFKEHPYQNTGKFIFGVLCIGAVIVLFLLPWE